MIAFGFKDDPRLLTPEQRAMKRFTEMLSVYQVPNSKVIVISFEANDPATAAEVANTLAEIYVTSTREAQSEPTGRAREWLSGQIESLRQKVVESERAAEQFRARAGLLKGRETTLSNESLSELNTQIILAATQRVEAQAKADAIRAALRKNGNVDAASEVLASSLIQRLREQQISVRRQVSELAVTYLPNHPKMIAARNELDDLDRQIRSEALKIVAGLEEQARIAEAREASLRDSLNAAKADVSDANLDEVRLREMEREAAANREILEALLNRYTDASARNSLAAQPGLARIVQSALQPSLPSFPRRGPTIMLAFIGGLATSLGLAFLLEIMSATTRLTAPPAQRASEQPEQAPVREDSPAVPPDPAAMAAAPRASEPPNSPAAAPPPSTEPRSRWAPYVEGTRPRPPILQAPSKQNPAVAISVVTTPRTPALRGVPHISGLEAARRIVADSSEQADPGFAAAAVELARLTRPQSDAPPVKTVAIGSVSGSALEAGTLAALFARQQARSGQRIMVVDAGRNGQEMQPVVGYPAGAGLAEVLVGQSKFADVIISDPVSSIHFLRPGQRILVAAQYFATSRMDAILRSLESSYDLVIVNAGSLDPAGCQLACLCHAAVVVAPEQRSIEADALSQALRSDKLTTVGIVHVSDAAADDGQADLSSVLRPSVTA
jgi:uncharacterized protein involved in exopolysaccharide biosynthesis/Mrp family chromosome partitioning ATPase